MTVEALMLLLEQAERDFGRTALVAVIHPESGLVFSVKEVVGEIHEDADNSATVWVKIEES